ncbi:putative ABC transporter substrate-binding protein [Gordonia hirsuta DSM 44140 = NBRC 16056]|uniref:Putative ABC transporter substrate-binding protein n=1 Tax=Gordonia hirsuta DSM 44140 = NBRC 16056 TaxID=1121927 RepID=L7LDQ1_9ACTN|nr:glutamate ABC transporter substrate-binding protein [Gordonia hirsuta]GAC58197.1 putative ABC transporter substrate-binding protein [Gordonia hirsuta DSM 44140 = NBRC 16056]
MRPGRRGLLAAAATALSAALLLTGCASSHLTGSNPPTTSASVPTPPGASFGAPAPEDVPSATCDPFTSLRAMSPLPEPGHMPAGSAMERIASRGRMVVGTDTGSNPMSFRDPISGDIRGFDIDIANWISEAIFGEVRIEYRILGTGDRVRALQDGDVDIVVKSMSITCERTELMDFSAPYYVASQRILVYRNSGIESVAGLAHKSVCATRNSTPIARIQRKVPGARLVTTNTWADCLVLMQQGQVDGIVSDEPLLSGIAQQDPWVRIVGDPIGTEYYGVGIPKGENDMVRFVNGVLEQRRADGSWQRAYTTWLSQLGPGIPPPTNYRD